MLQQILQDMWVDPGLLAELDDDQKQTLFCRMREEQVRRWRLWDQKLAEHPPPPRTKKNNAKTVQFLHGEDGEPWVWVMGEHPDDVPIEQILEQEAREKARQQAELEAQQLRLSELTELLDLNQKQIQEMASVTLSGTPAGPGDPLLDPSPPSSLPEEDPSEMIYCSVDELREWSKKKEENSTTLANNLKNNSNHISNNYSRNNNNQLSDNSSNNKFSLGRPPQRATPEKRERDVQISLNNKPLPKVAQRVAQWERRVLETRTEQILCNLKQKQQEAAREAEEMAPLQERLWQEQERRAKEAEQQIREIARRAREEHRRTSVLDDSSGLASPTSPTAAAPTESPPPLPQTPAPPQNREAVVQWYREQEEPRRAGLDASGAPQPWFHGLISRQEAEGRLSRPGQGPGQGSFLVRLSERVWGYAISYRDNGRCKHYLVDTNGPGGGYQFLGANQICHKSLEDLVNYHREHPITMLGGERLTEPCRRPSSPPPPASTAAGRIPPPLPMSQPPPAPLASRIPPPLPTSQPPPIPAASRLPPALPTSQPPPIPVTSRIPPPLATRPLPAIPVTQRPVFARSN